MPRATSAQLPLARHAGLVLVGYLTVGDEGLALGMKASPRDAPYRVDARVGAARAQLPSNVRDVGVGGFVPTGDAVVMGDVGNLAACEHASRMSNEHFYNLEFCSCQSQRLSIYEELS